MIHSILVKSIICFKAEGVAKINSCEIEVLNWQIHPLFVKRFQSMDG
ncbi:hypothetical protein TDB9533_02445 [Thalassocella blandensis]|nr:hypothetical protein TDB9533_02445 [Thalassocella blandensis]